MLQCPQQALAFAHLFYDLSSIFLLLFLLLHFTYILAPLFILLGANPFTQRNQDVSDVDEENELGEAQVEGGDHVLQDEIGEEVASNYATPDRDEVKENDVSKLEIHQADNKSCSISRFSDRGFKTGKLLLNVTMDYGKKCLKGRNWSKIIMALENSFTVGSTSKDSSEWRSSTNCRDSGTDDPFSSSSRRSCHNWESYTLFHKYEEEMLFLDRITAQKLQEAAQICLTWEALNWNYKYLNRIRASRKDYDPGCPAYTAQQFQQFQVLLQRYIENEPYEHGRRPQIYARMRASLPKLLQVPEYRDSEDGNVEDHSRLPSISFLWIMEESVTTFLCFLKTDKKSHCRIIKDFFRGSKRGGSLLFLLKKENIKKRKKVKELQSSNNCLRSRKKKEEEMEVLMASIDMKVVSRVLRMHYLNNEQLLWCENKMSKVKFSDGKLRRDPGLLFFPSH